MLKVGVCMNKREILKKVIENNGGIAKTSDFVANGINKYKVAAFCNKVMALAKTLVKTEELI